MFLNHSDASGRASVTSRRNGRNLSSTPRADDRSYCAAPRSFYSNRMPLRERTNLMSPVNASRPRDTCDLATENSHNYDWGPGDMLPEEVMQSRQNDDPFEKLHDYMQNLEYKIDATMNEFRSKLDGIEARITSVEKANTSPTLISSSSSDSSSSSGSKRKRRSPTDLQFQIRSIHASFEEDDQLHAHEGIDSEHNRKVVERIVKEVGTESFTSRQIREGCRIYRKSLHEKEKEKNDSDRKRMRLRSRQQRIFDRRKKEIGNKSDRIRRLWMDVTPDMMTEEETGTEDNYISHRQSWRSDQFNSLMDDLDKDKKTRTLARKRDIGDCVDRSTPPNAKKWMVIGQEEEIEQDNN